MLRGQLPPLPPMFPRACETAAKLVLYFSAFGAHPNYMAATFDPKTLGATVSGKWPPSTKDLVAAKESCYH